MINQTTKGAMAGVLASCIWGGMPLYMYWATVINGANGFELTTHRALWSLPLLAIILAISGRLKSAFLTFKDAPEMGWMVVSTLLITINWLVMIYAVNTDRTLQSSIGYYINPLFNVFLGFLFLQERLSKLQWGAVLLATLGVLNLVINAGIFPWISLVLAGSFGLYGLVRKRCSVGPRQGLFVETLILLPLTAGYLLYLLWTGESRFILGGIEPTFALLMGGAITSIPLALFHFAAKQLNYSTLGFMFYITPTGHFFCAVVLFNEPFTSAHFITFACIWGALILYNLGFLKQKTKAVPKIDR